MEGSRGCGFKSWFRQKPSQPPCPSPPPLSLPTLSPHPLPPPPTPTAHPSPHHPHIPHGPSVPSPVMLKNAQQPKKSLQMWINSAGWHGCNSWLFSGKSNLDFLWGKIINWENKEVCSQSSAYIKVLNGTRKCFALSRIQNDEKKKINRYGYPSLFSNQFEAQQSWKLWSLLPMSAT